MAIIKIQNADAEWFNGSGWYVLIEPELEIFGPFDDEQAATIKELVYLEQDVHNLQELG